MKRTRSFQWLATRAKHYSPHYTIFLAVSRCFWYCELLANRGPREITIGWAAFGRSDGGNFLLEQLTHPIYLYALSCLFGRCKPPPEWEVKMFAAGWYKRPSAAYRTQDRIIFGQKSPDRRILAKFSPSGCCFWFGLFSVKPSLSKA